MIICVLVRLIICVPYTQSFLSLFSIIHDFVLSIFCVSVARFFVSCSFEYPYLVCSSVYLCLVRSIIFVFKYVRAYISCLCNSIICVSYSGTSVLLTLNYLCLICSSIGVLKRFNICIPHAQLFLSFTSNVCVFGRSNIFRQTQILASSNGCI